MRATCPSWCSELPWSPCQSCYRTCCSWSLCAEEATSFPFIKSNASRRANQETAAHQGTLGRFQPAAPTPRSTHRLHTRVPTRRGCGSCCAGARSVNTGDLRAKMGDLKAGSKDVMWVTFSWGVVPNRMSRERTAHAYRSGSAWELRLNTLREVSTCFPLWIQNGRLRTIALLRHTSWAGVNSEVTQTPTLTAHLTAHRISCRSTSTPF
jgi:hypothetical protein